MDCQIHAWYDPDVDLLMVELPHGDALPSEREKLAPDVLLETEPDGAPLMLEVLHASAHYPREWLCTIPNAPDEHSAPAPGPHAAHRPRAASRIR